MFTQTFARSCVTVPLRSHSVLPNVGLLSFLLVHWILFFLLFSQPWFSDGRLWFVCICIMNVICMLRGGPYHENGSAGCLCVHVWSCMGTCVSLYVRGIHKAHVNYSFFFTQTKPRSVFSSAPPPTCTCMGELCIVWENSPYMCGACREAI